MSNPRYLPRDYAKGVGKFGRPGPVEWESPENYFGEAKLDAAKMQHQYAIRIRHALWRKGMSIDDYSINAGVSYDRMIKVLRGETILRLEDVAMADLLLGGVSEFAGQAEAESEPVANGATREADQSSGTSTRSAQTGPAIRVDERLMRR